VILRPIPASEFVQFDFIHQELLKSLGAVPVNDKLLPIWEKDYKILLLHGGRGGGKSEAPIDELLNCAINDKYFKCYYGRKVFDTVRGSCFATFDYAIKKNKLEAYFNYSVADNSSMIITCKSNGNKFIPFGSDKADKIKSIKDPTHIWCEEFDQFAFDDFKEMLPTLRTIRGQNIFIGTFNNYGILPSHWILKVFFPHLYEGLDKDDVANLDILKDISVKQIFVNYTDNYFINHKEYAASLLLSAAGNYTIFEGLANGAWGVAVNNTPWLFAFDKQKHVAKAELFADKKEILYLSFDFNRNPHVCTVIQWPQQKKLQIIEVIKKDNTGTEGICDIILEKYPTYLYVVTGDYSGDTASSIFNEQVTNYSMIKKKLILNDGQIKIEPNPKLAKNQTLVNIVFYKYPVEICPVKARPFIFDAENVKMMPDGTIEKKDRKDPAQQADVLDTVRYWVNMFLSWFHKV
jgi:PBSX family phage terminase large subunit